MERDYWSFSSGSFSKAGKAENRTFLLGNSSKLRSKFFRTYKYTSDLVNYLLWDGLRLPGKFALIREYLLLLSSIEIKPSKRTSRMWYKYRLRMIHGRVPITLAELTQSKIGEACMKAPSRS